MEFLRSHILEVVLGLAALIVLQLGFLLALNARLGRTSRLLRSLMTGPEGADLEEMLRSYNGRVESVEAQHSAVEAAISTLSAQLKGSVQNVGLVRFDAFGDVSGGQSFSVALLDGLGNGVIVTGLFGRSDSRCFGKSIRNGASEQSLSHEEEQALEIALGRAPAQVFDDGQAPKVRGRRAQVSR
jgi:hypothetical protein